MTFLDAAPWIVVFVALLVCYAPALRRTARFSLVMPATPGEVWRLLQPSGWPAYVHWKRCSDAVLIDEAARVWTYEERASLSAAATFTLTQPVYEEDRRLAEIAVARNGKEIPEKDRCTVQFDLTPCEEGVRVDVESRCEARLSLARYWIMKQSQQRQLYALRSYLRSLKPEADRRLRCEVRGWIWLSMLLVPFALHALFGTPVSGPALLVAAFLVAIELRELGHMFASLAFGRRRIVFAFSPFTGAATMRARAFRSKFETAVVSLAGPAFAAAAALIMTPAIGRVGGISAFGQGGVADSIDRACAAVAIFTLTLNLLALVPFRSSLGAVIVQAVARGTLERIVLVIATCAAVICVFPGSTPDAWPMLVAALMPPVLLWLVLWNVSGDADGFAQLPRRQAGKLVGSLAMVLALYGIVKTPLTAMTEMNHAAAQAAQQDEGAVAPKAPDIDI